MPGVDELAVQLAAISARLKEIGEGGLARELSRGIGNAVDPLEQEIRDGLRPHLPNRYADLINADLHVFRRTHTTPDEAQVTVYARTEGHAKRRLRRLDSGILWHPLFGQRGRWFEMGEPHVRPGWFSGPAEDATPRAREEIRKALDEVVRKAVAR